jgi:hypothetical protein
VAAAQRLALMPPRWVLVLSAVVTLSTCLPYAYHLLTTPPDAVFTGNCEQTADQNTYLMWARQVREGRLLVYDLHTSEDHQPIVPSLPWLALGLMGRVIPVPLPYLYHACRLVLGLAYLLLVYLVLSEFFDSERERTYAFMIVAVGSGFGAVTDSINAGAGRTVILSADLMPELWAYHSLLVLPHFTLALVAVAALLYCLLRAHRRPTWRLALAAALCLALLTLVHPFTAAVMVPLLALHFVASRLIKPSGWRAAWVDLVALLGFLPPAAFLAWQVSSSEIMRAWSAQNVLPSPPPLVYMIGFGVVFPLALLGMAVILRKVERSAADWLVILWPMVAAIGAYSGPLIKFERRCVEGVHLPLAMLAAVAITGWAAPLLRGRLGWGERTAQRACLAILLLLILPTNVKLLVDDSLSQEGVIPADWLRAFGWLRDNTQESARVMTPPLVGNFAARYAERRVYAGHRQQTIDYERKRETARRFFDPATPDAERFRILLASRCEFVAADAEHRPALAGWPPLQEVFSSAEMSVYCFPSAAGS